MEIGQMAALTTMDISAKEALDRVYKYAVPRNFIVGSAAALVAWYAPRLLHTFSGPLAYTAYSNNFDFELFGLKVFKPIAYLTFPILYSQDSATDLAYSTRIPAFFITSFTLNVLAQVIFGDKEKNMRPNQNVQQPAITASSMNAEPARQVSDSSISKKDMAIVETKN